LKTPSLEVVVENTETPAFSFDGEIRHVDRLSASVRPDALSLRVGDGYEPCPDTE
jgi:diacylglycerol kinase family enzyme